MTTSGDKPLRHFGTLLRQFRIESGLTQRALALRSGVAERTISDLERGVARSPQAATFHLLSEALALDDASRAALVESVREHIAQPPATDAAIIAGRAWTERRRTLWGREDLLELVESRLGPGVIVTLTGPGGIGKSRLAQAAAARAAANGIEVYGVSLETLGPEEDPLPTIARAAGAADAESADRLAAALADRPVLLLIDNAESAPAVGRIAAALAAADPGLRLLITSRTPTAAAGERTIPVPPLPLPAPRSDRPSAAELSANPAVSLFRERARQAGAPIDDLPIETIADLVIRLDGMPLAIELAAAQTTSLSPASILAMLDRSGLEVLEGPSGRNRQHRMDLVIAASAVQLDPAARRLLAISGVFSGGFSLDALTAVTVGIGEPDLLAGLPALVRAAFIHETDIPGRFGMLEPIRMFAAHLLGVSGSLDRVREAHARWAAEVARRTADRSLGPRLREALADEAADRANLLSAFTWATASGRPALAAAIAVPIYRLWEAAFVVLPMVDTFEALASQAAAITDPGDRAMALFFAVYSQNVLGHVPAAQRWIARLRSLMVGDPVAVALAGLAESLVGVSDPARVRRVLSEAVMALEDAHHPLLWAARLRLGTEMQLTGEAEEGIALVRDVLAGMERAGNIFDQPVPLLQLGISLADLDRLDEARAIYRRMIDLCLRYDFTHALFRAFMGYAEAAMRDPVPMQARIGALVYGASRTMSIRFGAPQVRWWEARLEHARAQASALIGEDRVAWLIIEGQSIEPDEAARLALGR